MSAYDDQAAEITDQAIAGILADRQAMEPRTFADSLIRRSQLRDLPKITPLIQDLVSLRSTVVMVGPTGVGKTIVAMSMACSTGTGRDWLGRPVARVPALYVVGEGAYGLGCVSWIMGCGVGPVSPAAR